jgi:predicted MPP superfamily phosphohydrolase
MLFIAVCIYGYCLVASLLIFFIVRDSHRPETFLSRHPILASVIGGILALGIILALYAHLIEPYRLVTTRASVPVRVTSPIRVGLVADMQVGMHKKSEWMEKVTTKALAEKPDIILIAGDLVANEGTLEDESVYLEPLKKLVGVIPVYYVLGNHDYGVATKPGLTFNSINGDKHELVMARMQALGIPLLRNELICPTFQTQTLCIFGTDDIWGSQADYTRLSAWDTAKPLILLSHNPDAILSWPTTLKKPDIFLAGHTHGGQVYLPFFGPLGNAGVDLGKNYYRGLNYWNGIPIFTTVGSGESLGSLRLFTPPEVAIITLTP